MFKTTTDLIQKQQFVNWAICVFEKEQIFQFLKKISKFRKII